ncbi:MAG: helix-turn-helix domain-containing protein [Oceanicaulis sp.]
MTDQIEAAEDAEDRAALAEWRASDDDPVSTQTMRRLLDPTQSKVRVWREHRGLSGAELAAAANVSAPYLSQIETGRREPGLKALKSIAAALKVDLDDLV